MPRFQAIFGIASPAQRESAQKVVRRRAANFARRNFMEPPALGTDGFGKFMVRSLQNRYCRPDSSIREETDSAGLQLRRSALCEYNSARITTRSVLARPQANSDFRNIV